MEKGKRGQRFLSIINHKRNKSALEDIRAVTTIHKGNFAKSMSLGGSVHYPALGNLLDVCFPFQKECGREETESRGCD